MLSPSDPPPGEAPSLLSRKLIVVTGKGGVGKTTIAAAIGMIAARHRLRTLIVDLADGSVRLREVFLGVPGTPADGEPSDAMASRRREQGAQQVAPFLSVSSIDPEAAMLEWMQELGGRLPARMLASRTSFQYFAAAAPGAKELVCVLKLSRLASAPQDRYDLIVLDAPATGHALALLESPRTFSSIARVGPVAEQADEIAAMLSDPEQTGYVAVTLATEMAVTETLELDAGLRSQVGLGLSLVIVNATMRRRFTGEELRRIESLRSGGGEHEPSTGGALSPAGRLAEAAANAANAAHLRTRSQHSQVARLRRKGHEVVRVPFMFEPNLDLESLARIANELEGKL